MTFIPDWTSFLAPVWLSLRVALVADAIVFVLGTAAARTMRRRRFRGHTVLETAFMLPLVLPPTVVGLILLALLGRRSAVGRILEHLFGSPLLFTWWAAVLASVVVAFPLVYQTAKVGFMGVDRDLEDAARSMGASEAQVLRYVTFPLARRSLATAALLGFARAIGEFGATLMIAGNIPGRTTTVPTAIYTAAESGHLPLAWAWTGAVILLSFGMMLIAGRRT